MPNSFYNDFDTAYLEGTGPKIQLDHRHPFAFDRDRLVFSFAFRRLQSKTQVFQSGVYDYYRTRLTHSIEVARIGCSICEWLLRDGKSPLNDNFFIDRDLVEAVCLGHDLGHPCYGHIGERKLNELMRDYGGFEGNAQTLRMLTALIYKNGTEGLCPTRAFTDGVMKYKALRSEFLTTTGKQPSNHFLYDDQVRLRQFVFGNTDHTPALPTITELNTCKSIECQIMDWADDSAYCLHDILDGIQTGFITHRKLLDWKEAHPALDADILVHIDKLIESTLTGNIEARLSRKIGTFINACSLEPRQHFMAQQTQRYAWNLVIEESARRECKLYKMLAVDLIFRSTHIQQLEFKGGMFLERIFNALMEHYNENLEHPLTLLPETINERIRKTPDNVVKTRIICDFLSSLTDIAAPRLYKRLFDPDTGFSELPW